MHFAPTPLTIDTPHAAARPLPFAGGSSGSGALLPLPFLPLPLPWRGWGDARGATVSRQKFGLGRRARTPGRFELSKGTFRSRMGRDAGTRAPRCEHAALRVRGELTAGGHQWVRRSASNARKVPRSPVSCRRSPDVHRNVEGFAPQCCEILNDCLQTHPREEGPTAPSLGPCLSAPNRKSVAVLLCSVALLVVH